MKPLLLESYKKLKNDDSLEEISEVMTVKALHGADGISTVGFKTDCINTLPPKVYVSGIRILRITICLNGENSETLLYRNKIPNSPHQVPCCNLICDENSDFSLRTIHHKIDPFLDKLRNYELHVSDLKFSVIIDLQGDGKLKTRMLSTAGANHFYNCNQCENSKFQIDKVGTKRNLETMIQTSTRCLWNPLKTEQIQLYHESKGGLYTLNSILYTL